MVFKTEESAVVIGEKDGYKFTAVYTHEYSACDEGGKVSVLVTVPRGKSVDAVWDLASVDEPIDFIPDYVADELDAMGSEFADEGHVLAATVINVLDACSMCEYDVMDDIYLGGFASAFATYETHTEAKSR